MSSHAHNTNACYAENLTQRTDPSHTLEIRQNFLREIRRRFKIVRGLIRKTVGYENDAFNLTQNQDPPEAYDFPTDKAKIDAFIRDVKAWIQEHILEPANFSKKREGQHWTHEFINAAYIQGHKQAVGRLKQEGVSATVLDQQELLNRPVRVKTLKDLYIRVYENLEGISSDMADSIRQEVTQGFAQGENPRRIADRITKEVRTIQHTRAETLARTEVIQAHSSATLDEYENAGVDVVSHNEWRSARDSRVCPVCRALDGREFTITEMRNEAFRLPGISYDINLRPPAHPNCRCVILPIVGGEPPTTPLEQRLPDEPVEA